MKRVGVRELRQNLSVWLRRVEAGEQFEVTDRGRPVARLSPVPQQAHPLGDLIASGSVIPAAHDLRDAPRPAGRVSRRGSKALDEVRADRI